MRISALVGATALALTLTACGSSDDAAKTDPMKDADSSSMTDDGMAKDDMTNGDAMGAARSGTFAGLNGKKVAGM